MKKSTVILMWGVITGIVLALFKEVTVNMNNAIQLLGIVFFFGGLLVATLQYRNKVNGGFGSFGNLYGFAILVSLVAGVIGIIHSFIFREIHQDVIQSMLSQTRAIMVAQRAPEAQIEMSIKFKDWMVENPAGIVIMGIFGSAFMGALLGLLSAGITAKRKPIFEENTTDTIE